jgi:hypothetical protein
MLTQQIDNDSVGNGQCGLWLGSSLGILSRQPPKEQAVNGFLTASRLSFAASGTTAFNTHVHFKSVPVIEYPRS